MYVKYVTHSNATVSSIQADIIKLVNGQISTANDFGVNCQRSNTVIRGTFPTGTYAVSNSNSNTMTFSKVHNEFSDTTHYFRIHSNATHWVATTLARSYTAGTDTLVNGVQYPSTNTATNMTGTVTYHIIVGDKLFHMSCDAGTSKQHTILDIGKTGVTRSFTNSMLMCHMSDINPGNTANGGTIAIPHTYNLDTETYGAVANLFFDFSTPGKKGLSNGTLYALENPCMTFSNSAANTRHFVYGMVRPSTLSYVQNATYADNTGAYRYYFNGFSLIAE